MGTLLKKHFEVEEYSNVPGERSLIGQYKIPKDKVLIIPRSKKLRLYFPVRETESFSEETDREEITVETSLKIADSPGRSAKSEVYAEWDGEEAEVLNVDYENNEITIAADDTAADAEISYLPAAGGLEIIAEAPEGRRQQKEFFDDRLAIIHESEQISGSAINPAMDFALPQDFRLSIYTDVNADIDMDHRNAVVQIQYKTVSVNDFVSRLLRSEKLTEEERRLARENDIDEIVMRSWSERG